MTETDANYDARFGRALVRKDGKLYYLDKLLADGPWHSEPDHVEFRHAGFPCLLHRGPLGAWCGYVAVPPGHPWHGKEYDDVRIGDDEWPDVHGGLTYANSCQVGGAICHKPKRGEPEDVWWLGFDCNHSGDISLGDIHWQHEDRPVLRALAREVYGWRESYKTVDYAHGQTRGLAEQARQAGAR